MPVTSQRGLGLLLLRLRRRLRQRSLKSPPPPPLLLLAASMTLLPLLLLLLHDFVDGIVKGPEAAFQQAVTDSEAEEMRQLLMTFAIAMRDANVTFYLVSGALLGSIRHHGRVPWDDDIDVMVPKSESSRMSSALKRLSPTFLLHCHAPLESGMGKWKFFRPNGRRFRLQPWLPFTWPYVDIFFAESVNSTHMRNALDTSFVFSLSSLHPLRLRPFDGLLVPTPCDPVGFLRAEFADLDVADCVSSGFSHSLELPLPPWRRRRLKCRRLADRFHFVSVGSDAVETLRRRNRTLASFRPETGRCTGVERRLAGTGWPDT